MLKLNNSIPITPENISAQNLTHLLDDDDLATLGDWVYSGYLTDKESRRDWEERTAAAMDLAMQITANKNFPWPDCSNVALPLVTIAIMQFHARAYPALVSGPNVVKVRVVGDDPDGSERSRAARVSTHMSWQCLEEDQSWEEQHDRLCINVACVGTAFKKTYFKGVTTSDLVMAKDLVLNYFSKSVDSSPRKTHIIPLYRNDIYERVRRNQFADILDAPWFNDISSGLSHNQNYNEDQRHGIRPGVADEITPYITLEQHVNIDLDQDGYAEPYIITIEESTQTVLRIVMRFERPEDVERNSSDDIIAISAREYFTKYPFIPSPDGGIYDIGFGVLLGPLNESANSIVNQLIDAGTMATTAGGFLGRGAAIRGGDYTFSPLEWKRIDSTAEDLRKAIFPLPTHEPSAVLFQLLNVIIQYTNKVSGSTDMITGDNPGQNTPAETSRTMVEQGAKVYSAILKRIWRSMKDEFKKRYILNGIYTPVGRAISFGGDSMKVYRDDYLGDPSHIIPAADPSITNDIQGLQRAQIIKQNAMMTPGYNLQEVEHDFLQAMHIDNIDRIYPGPDKVPPLPNPKVQLEQMKLQAKQQELELEKMMFIAELQEQMKLNQAKILELQAKAMKEAAEADGVKEGHQVAALNAAIGAMKQHNESMTRKVELLLKGMEINQNAGRNPEQGRMAGMANAPGNKNAPGSPGSPQGELQGAVG